MAKNKLVVCLVILFIIACGLVAGLSHHLKQDERTIATQKEKLEKYAKEYIKVSNDNIALENNLSKAEKTIDKKHKRVVELKDKVKNAKNRNAQLKYKLSEKNRKIKNERYINKQKQAEINRLQQEVQRLKKAKSTPHKRSVTISSVAKKTVGVQKSTQATKPKVDSKTISKPVVKNTTYQQKKEPVQKAVNHTETNTNNSVSNDTGYSSWRKIVVQATGYSNVGDPTGGGNITATGTSVGWGTIAVDPSVIPLGSTVYIPEFGQTFRALDTGGAIKGNIIDIFFNHGDQARQWGRRTITIYVK